MARRTAERRARLLGEKERWTEQDAREALAAWEASGESIAAFARGVGIVPQRLLWWRSRLGRPARDFVPVEVTGLGPAAVMTTKGGTRIEVAAVDAASAQWVTTVVRAMGERGR
jgi:transposase-like protein